MKALADPVVKLESFGKGGDFRSFTFRGFQTEVIARSPDEVMPALAAVEAANACGKHAAGYVAYEAASGLDSSLVCHPAREDSPLLWFGVFEHRDESEPESDGIGRHESPRWIPSIDRARYEADLARIRDFIGAGDTYQVNYTFQMLAERVGNPWELYRELCRSQKANYCAFIDTGSHQILSASPELFFSLKSRELTTRPMKGTHPRGRSSVEDNRYAQNLANSEKDRAENLMIVDLLRNDMGRVCETGTIEVDELWHVEPYETLFQMTSTIRGQVANGVGLTQLFEALFPCGSVTGAPKVRTMEIISGLETSVRGVYTGAIGYSSPGDEAMFSVAIRTVCIDRKEGKGVFGVGGGITWDSTPQNEYQECLTKTRVLTERRPEFYLFETLRHEPGKGCFLFDRHLARLSSSADRFGYPYNRHAAEDELTRAEEACDAPSRIRLILKSDGTVSSECFALTQVAPDAYTASVCPLPVDSSDVFLYHKTSHREVYDRRFALASGVDDVILVNERGELTETRIGNLVLEMDGRLITPPVDSGLLAGTFRQELIKRGEIEECVLTVRDLQRAQKVFMVNSVREWVPVSVREWIPTQTSLTTTEVEGTVETTLSAGS